jgi:hypothetical protein
MSEKRKKKSDAKMTVEWWSRGNGACGHICNEGFYSLQ